MRVEDYGIWYRLFYYEGRCDSLEYDVFLNETVLCIDPTRILFFVEKLINSRVVCKYHILYSSAFDTLSLDAFILKTDNNAIKQFLLKKHNKQELFLRLE